MSKKHPENTRIKRKYLVWLEEARGYSEASVAKVAASLSVYEVFLKGAGFSTFHAERARAFKRHLTTLKNSKTSAPLSASSIGGILRDVKAFFSWLADQVGYKSKISRSDIDYLTPDKKTDAARRSSLWKPHPSPEQARAVVAQMPSDTVVHRRNRALVAFLFLTGSRETAAISMPLGCLNLRDRLVQFDARLVTTKFAKSFSTAFFPIGGNLEQVLNDWVQELKSDHLFSATDPLFPKTKVGVGPARGFTVLGIDRAFWSSASSAAKIFKRAFEGAGLPPYSPHRVRDTIVELANEFCKTPEDFKVWSQNLGHDSVLTTFRSYGTVAPGRQVEIMARFSEEKDFDVIE